MLSPSEIIKKLKNYYASKLKPDLYFIIYLPLNFDQRYFILNINTKNIGEIKVNLMGQF